MSIGMATAVILAAEVSNLAPLAEWEPIGTRLELLTAAVAGEGMNRRDITELRSLAARWRRLGPVLRNFYVDNIDNDNVRACLWLVLTSRRVPGTRYGFLKRLWIDQHGAPPLMDLCPSR